MPQGRRRGRPPGDRASARACPWARPCRSAPAPGPADDRPGRGIGQGCGRHPPRLAMTSTERPGERNRSARTDPRASRAGLSRLGDSYPTRSPRSCAMLSRPTIRSSSRYSCGFLAMRPLSGLDHQSAEGPGLDPSYDRLDAQAGPVEHANRSILGQDRRLDDVLGDSICPSRRRRRGA